MSYTPEEIYEKLLERPNMAIECHYSPHGRETFTEFVARWRRNNPALHGYPVLSVSVTATDFRGRVDVVTVSMEEAITTMHFFGLINREGFRRGGILHSVPVALTLGTGDHPVGALELLTNTKRGNPPMEMNISELITNLYGTARTAVG